MAYLPKVLFIGGPDVDARLEMMHHLACDFDLSALGSEPTLRDKFAAASFPYGSYHLSRRANLAVDLWGVGQLVAAIRKIKPDLAHTFATKPGVWGRLAARLAGVPIIIGTLPGLGSLYTGNDIKIRAMRLAYQPLQKLTCHLSDLTIFQNHDDARQLVAENVVPPHKTMVIPGSGVSTERFDPARVSLDERIRLKQELGLQPDAVVVTMVSRVMRSKGVLEFMTAARQVCAEAWPAHFLLVGPADEGVDRLSPAELEQLRQAVTWPGRRGDIPVVLAVSDIFVLPSAYREGIPRVLLEAASMGLPIVTTDSPGCNEVVENNRNGFLIPVHDGSALAQALLTLIGQPALRRRFGRQSRRLALERFDLPVVAAQTRSVYRRLLIQKNIGPVGNLFST